MKFFCEVKIRSALGTRHNIQCCFSVCIILIWQKEEEEWNEREIGDDVGEVFGVFVDMAMFWTIVEFMNGSRGMDGKSIAFYTKIRVQF